jgi:hypothetical protein
MHSPHMQRNIVYHLVFHYYVECIAAVVHPDISRINIRAVILQAVCEMVLRSHVTLSFQSEAAE